MLKSVIVAVVLILACAPAGASEPGQPLDCSDFVFLEPGLSCNFRACPTPACSQWAVGLPAGSGSPATPATDNEGDLLYLRTSTLGFCSEGPKHRTELVRFRGQTESVIAYVDERCQGGNSIDQFRPLSPLGDTRNTGPILTFNLTRGTLFIPASTQAYGGYGYPNASWIVVISGFTTLFDIVQTYTPTPDSLSFRVPAHPEGLRAADRFDSYWGRVADLPDFRRAHPMACNVPGDHLPQPGEYVTIPDTSPLPPIGTASYVVTAVTRSTETRYGRKRISGVLSGRDPALLPACPAAQGAETP